MQLRINFEMFFGCGIPCWLFGFVSKLATGYGDPRQSVAWLNPSRQWPLVATTGAAPGQVLVDVAEAVQPMEMARARDDHVSYGGGHTSQPAVAVVLGSPVVVPGQPSSSECHSGRRTRRNHRRRPRRHHLDLPERRQVRWPVEGRGRRRRSSPVHYARDGHLHLLRGREQVRRPVQGRRAPTGEGTFTYADGDKYAGQWKDGKKHGQGTFTWTNGNKYVGEMFENDFHGQGTKTFANGTVQKGRFEHDRFICEPVPPAPVPPQSPSATAAAAMLVDTTGDGLADSVHVDTTGDGRPDTIVPLEESAHARRPIASEIELEVQELRKSLAEAKRQSSLTRQALEDALHAGGGERARRWRASRAPAAPVPPQYLCPITGEIMEDPVRRPTGTRTSAPPSRSGSRRTTRAVTNAQLPHRKLAPAHALRQLIEEFVATNTAM